MTSPAETVVWRHPCDCPTASRPLTEGEEAEHRFDVDGKPFPWVLPEDHGVVFTRLLDDLWRIDIQFFAIPTNGLKPVIPEGESVVFSQVFRGWQQPVIAGIEFPWVISDDGVAFQCGGKILPRVTLAFFARDVDTDGPWIDQRDRRGEIVDNTGSLWRHGEGSDG